MNDCENARFQAAGVVAIGAHDTQRQRIGADGHVEHPSADRFGRADERVVFIGRPNDVGRQRDRLNRLRGRRRGDRWVISGEGRDLRSGKKTCGDDCRDERVHVAFPSLLVFRILLGIKGLAYRFADEHHEHQRHGKRPKRRQGQP